jgi:transmembrane sensor
MTQYDFDKLLEKYLQGACTPEEELLLDEWANRQMNSETKALSEEETAIVKKRLWKRIKHNNLPDTPLSIQWFSWTKLGIAASFLFLLSWGFMWYNNTYSIKKSSYPSNKLTGIEMTNTTAKAQIITLNDGSTVTLQPQSMLTFPEKFGDHNRVVYLKGEGYFQIKRDTTKPFYVYADNLVTEVLGTSFVIKSNEKDKISEVIVTSGKVKVYNAHAIEGGNKIIKPIILTPNQKVVFEKTTQQITPQMVEKPRALNPSKMRESFLFQETPLLIVLNKIEEVYGLKIIVNPNLKDCVFTGDLNDLELYEQLDWICKSINTKYEKVETTIVINGEGCQ